jgi:hypothetical protein
MEYFTLWDAVHNFTLNVHEQDSVTWRQTPSGSYTAKSAYELSFVGRTVLAGAHELWMAGAPLKHKIRVVGAEGSPMDGVLVGETRAPSLPPLPAQLPGDGNHRAHHSAMILLQGGVVSHAPSTAATQIHPSSVGINQDMVA